MDAFYEILGIIGKLDIQNDGLEIYGRFSIIHKQKGKINKVHFPITIFTQFPNQQTMVLMSAIRTYCFLGYIYIYDL